jgi:sugar lactone lactonase YvrE
MASRATKWAVASAVRATLEGTREDVSTASSARTVLSVFCDATEPHLELHMSRISVQAARPEIHRAAIAGAAPVIVPWFPTRQIRSWTLALAALLPVVAGARAQSAFGTQPVGSPSGGQNVIVTARAAGTVATVEVLTLGVAGLDFAKGIGALDCENATLGTGAACMESVIFTPAAPGLRMGAVVLVDGNGNVLGTTYISGTGLGGLGVLVPGNVLLVAGDGIYKGAVLDGSPATAASLYLPTSVTLDGVGNMYIADCLHNRVRKVTASTGLISTIAGNGNPTYTGDNGPAVNATLNAPSGVALDGAGNLYIADTGNNAVREIAASTGVIATVAGNGTPGSAGNGVAATSAELDQPQGITVDANGNLYIADTSNHLIRKVDVLSGILSTVAGNGTTNPATGDGSYSGDNGPAIQAGLDFPYAVAFDAGGNMYIPDSKNNVVRKVAAVNGVLAASGIITTFAGTGAAGFSGDGGAAAAAQVWSPEGVIADPAGNLYIADTQNAAIRKVSSATGFISMIAQSGSSEDFNGGALAAVSFYGPIGLFLDGGGNLYFADSLNMNVQEIQSNVAALDFTRSPDGTTISVRQGEKSATQLQEVENDGNAAFDLTAITVGQNAALDPAATTCALSPPMMAVNEDCEIGVVFAPSTTVVIPPPATEAELTGTIDVAASTVNTPLQIEAIGIAAVVNATTTTLTSNLNPSGFGQAVTLTATVTTGAETGMLTGTVTFAVDGVAAGSPVTLNAAGVAVYATSALTVGVHTVTASYNNDPAHFPSTSTPLTQSVLEGTVVALASSLNPSNAGAPVTFTAAVTVPAGGGNVPPDGTVVFTDGATALGNAALSATGAASFTTSTLANGVHSIAATYLGDASSQIQGSTSTVLVQDVLVPGKVSLVSNPNPSNYGAPITFIVAVAPTGIAAATGTVNILDGAQQIGTGTLAGGTGQTTFTTSALAVGSHSITAAYLGDSTYGASTSAAIAQVVNQAQTSTAVAAPVPNPGIAGGPVAITAVVTVTEGVSTPAGTVAFTSGTATLGSATLGASGTAAIDSTFAPGAYPIIATYSGDANNGPSVSAPYSLTVQLATTATAVAANPSPAVVESPVSFVAKVTGNGGIPTGSVVFSADGASMGTATLDSTGVATLSYGALAPGIHSIASSYAGDANDSPSASPAVSLVVTTIPTATALGTSSTTDASAQITLVAAVVGAAGPTPTGIVTFNAGTTAIGSATLDSSGVATLIPNLAAGTYIIVAVYSGDSIHSPSISQPATVSGTPAGFNLTVSPSTVSMATGQNATIAITLTSISGFADADIGLGCASLPAMVTCRFSGVSVNLAANGSQTAQLTIDTDNPLSGGASAMNARPGSRGATMAGLSILPVLSLPLCVFFGWILRRFRKRHSAVWTIALVLLLSSAAMPVNGCSGFSQTTATPGTYVIQVTATGTNSDVIHYQSLTLNITQ